jgi:glycosyltransferase involved in cell wall biosynthesis
MTLCVAICTRNRADQLAACLESIESSSAVDEVVVSSDGSDNETETVALAASGMFRRFRFLRGPRSGLAANRNNCIAAITSDYVLFLDDDARLSASFVEKALQVARPDTLVTGWELRNGEKARPHDPDFLGFQRDVPKGNPKGIVINSTLFPVKFLRSRGFDPFYRFGSEEVDIAFGAVNQGMNIVVIDEGNVHLHVESSRGGNDDAATVSRVYFGVRRYRDYERSWSNLARFLVLSLSNTLGSRIKSRQFAALPSIASEFVRAVCAAWIVQGRVLKGPNPDSLRWSGDRQLFTADIGSTAPTVLIPTYLRPKELSRCLDAVLSQSRKPSEVIVVRRDIDGDAARVIQAVGQAVSEVVVSEGGTVAALRAGLAHASGELIAVVDDDAVPRYDWLAQLEACFDDKSVGAVGGRDVVHHAGIIEEGRAPIVGRLMWYGKPIGNHHLGSGIARDVDFLKGCNYAFRREQFRIPTGLLGSGAQVSHDMASCLEVRRLGSKVVYDPRIVVDHYPAERFDDDGRSTVSRRARNEGAFNEAYSVCSLARTLRTRYLLYHLIIGDVGTPGLVRSLIGRVRREEAVRGRLFSSWAALIRAYRLSAVSPLAMWQPNE